MRARKLNPARAGARWLVALLAAFSVAGGWAQETPAEDQVMPEPPKPPAAAEAPRSPQQERVEKQVRITRDQNGNLRIRTRDENGDRSEVQVDLGAEFGGALSRRIIEKLENKGILDERGLIVEEALDSVPKNINIGISGDFDEPRGGHHDAHDHDDFPFKGDAAVMIPIISILAVFGTPILIVWLVTRNSYRKKQLLMDNINRMVAEGRDIPPELLDAMEGESPRNMKDRGFTLIAVGLAIFIWLTVAAGPEAGSLGLIPLFIGVARFVNWKLDNKQPQQ
ncbi:hypothetical protein SAMN04487965_0557 [Microbulbifer donghaiensis]|uniref:DUF6249 domain-containing protein n=1 Tax=Microbulbifer donghaiensis TaxID=494016 RepID=A0A1M4VZT2_9GAMM|nr:DUF6249 domain-containing protein [Microbulbifer donghaiensis]SHE74457.1 hypothetical protein SAMN04487965_0557 [Microbulbifer donghaiensis]